MDVHSLSLFSMWQLEAFIIYNRGVGMINISNVLLYLLFCSTNESCFYRRYLSSLADEATAQTNLNFLLQSMDKLALGIIKFYF
jgi:hypothetical protein